MFWGLTPALDLLKELEDHDGNLPEEINILIVGGADARHVLQTVAKRYRHKSPKINFYLAEACVETVAKQLLLLNIALQPDNVLGLEQKTKVFMELYGNTMVRPSVAKYLASVAHELVKMVTNYDYLNKLMSCVTLDIKYKERDYLENLLKFWCGKEEFDICHSWDRRLRNFLGVRYDSRMGSFDWDLHMRFHTIGGKQVCPQEYKNFRLNGIAFSWLESEVSKPNRSMVCGIIPNGDKYLHHGYLGDMQTGPFVSFGLSCEDKDFMKSTNGLNSFRATDVTERNLKQIFYELMYQEEYEHHKITDYLMGTMVIKDEKLIVDLKGVDVVAKPGARCVQLENVKIKFVSISNLKTMEYKEEYKDMFHLIYFGSTYLKYITKPLLENIAKINSLILLENQLFVLSKRKKELEEHAKDIDSKMESLDWRKLHFEVEESNYVKIVRNK